MRVKQALKIEGNSEAAASLLLHLAILLAHHKLQPRSLIWSLGETRDIQLWIVVEGDGATLSVFTEECRHQSGVLYLSEQPAHDAAAALDAFRDTAGSG